MSVSRLMSQCPPANGRLRRENQRPGWRPASAVGRRHAGRACGRARGATHQHPAADPRNATKADAAPAGDHRARHRSGAARPARPDQPALPLQHADLPRQLIQPPIRSRREACVERLGADLPLPAAARATRLRAALGGARASPSRTSRSSARASASACPSNRRSTCRTRRPLLPSLILQPLVENAVKHGIARARHGGHISVSARIEPAASVPRAAHRGHRYRRRARRGPGRRAVGGVNGVGLQLVERRLRACYGETASVSLRRDEAASVTIAELRLPAGRTAISDGPSPQPSPRRRGEGADAERLVS